MTEILKSMQPPELAKIDELRKKLSGSGKGDYESFLEWEAATKRALLTLDAAKHEGVKAILDMIDEKVLDIAYRLEREKSATLPDKDRDNLIDFKNFMLWFRGLFQEAKQNLKEVGESVDEELQKD